jgi:glycosyltransferase involved in cell wall biosynthesis
VVCAFAGADPDAPYGALGDLPDSLSIVMLDREPELAQVRRVAAELEPDLVLCCGWHIRAYRRLMRELRGVAVRLLYFDTQWLNTPRQRLRKTVASRVMAGIGDGLFLPGVRQVDFVKRTGVDLPTYTGACVADQRIFFDRGLMRDRSFVFVGRLVEEKGLDVLAESYSTYRAAAGAAAWSLDIAGTGPLSNDIGCVGGVRMHGFLDATELATLLNRSRAFVLPSRFEPWGVVVHEAMCCGLPCIVSTASGAGADLVAGGGGQLVPTGDVQALTAALHDISSMDDRSLDERSRQVTRRAGELTPETWCDTIERAFHDLQARVR